MYSGITVWKSVHLRFSIVVHVLTKELEKEWYKEKARH